MFVAKTQFLSIFVQCATQFCRPEIFQTMNSVRLNHLISLKHYGHHQAIEI